MVPPDFCNSGFIDYQSCLDFVSECAVRGLPHIEATLNASLESLSIPFLLKLSLDHPQKHCRDVCASILHACRNRGYSVPKKAFSSLSECVADHVFESIHENPVVHRCFQQYFDLTGFLPLYLKVLAVHPGYLERFVDFELYIMHSSDGAMPLVSRDYLAILTASQMRCSNLVKLYSNLFLYHGGDSRWLEGSSHCSEKFSKISDLLSRCVHRPFLITHEQLRKLIAPGRDFWTLSEIMHALLVISHISLVACIVLGLKISPEIELEGGHTFSDTAGNGSMSPSYNGITEISLLLMNVAKEKSNSSSASESMSLEENLREFEQINDCDSGTADVSSLSPKDYDEVKRFLPDPSFQYADFVSRENKLKYPALKTSEFNWEQHGYSTLERYRHEASQLLDLKFTTIQNLTYNMIGSKPGIDTTVFRQCVWNYVSVLFGIFRDDYKYHEVNKLMLRHFKAFCKKFVCYPKQLVLCDYTSWQSELYFSEVIHIAILLVESRIQAQLIYSLKAVKDHLL